MFVSKVKLYKFRNLADQQVELSEGPVYISGLNGNGKTNLIEAVYLLTGSRSFRTNSTTELLRFGERECSVFGTVTQASGTEELGLVFTASGRTGSLNGEALDSITELLGRLRAVSFSPADLSLVKGAPAGRRKFLDRHMVDLQPGYLKTLLGYQRALANKSALLKQQNTTYPQLKVWNELLAEHGGKVVDNRRNFIESLSDKSASFHSEYAPSDGPLTLELESAMTEEGQGARDSRDQLLEQLERAAPREIAMRSPVVGPHRDDIKISISGVDCRSYASQGQTRSVVLSMKLGVIELIESQNGEAPVILLDDVDSELDAGRSERLFAALLRKPRQLIITGTTSPPEQLGRHSALQLLRVKKGIVGPA